MLFNENAEPVLFLIGMLVVVFLLALFWLLIAGVVAMFPEDSCAKFSVDGCVVVLLGVSFL